jgi:hypothetical protein
MYRTTVDRWPLAQKITRPTSEAVNPTVADEAVTVAFPAISDPLTACAAVPIRSVPKAAELDAKRRAKHDYLRLLFYIFMIILLFFNYLRWSSSNAKVSEMQKTIEQLEKVIHQFVQSQSTCTK